MRLKITLKGKCGSFFPFNYNYILASIIYRKFDNLLFSTYLHEKDSYKFFTFSNLIFDDKEVDKNGLISKNGIIYFYVSSCDDYLIKRLLSGIIDDLEINFRGQIFEIINVEVIPTPNFRNNCRFKTISPILIHKTKRIDGRPKIYDIYPSPEFLDRMKNILTNKYLSYNDLEDTDKKIRISADLKNCKSKRVSLKTGKSKTFNISHFMNLTLFGDEDLIEFAYDTGLGLKNSMGFGMIEKMSTTSFHW